MDGTSEEREFAVGEPFFEDLVAAEGVGPDVMWDGGPAGGAVQAEIDADVSTNLEGLVKGEVLDFAEY